MRESRRSSPVGERELHRQLRGQSGAEDCGCGAVEGFVIRERARLHAVICSSPRRRPGGDATEARGSFANYGHDLLIYGATGHEGPGVAGRGRIQATLRLEGYDETYKSACPQLGFAADFAPRQIAVYASDRVPHKDGVSDQQTTRTIGASMPLREWRVCAPRHLRHSTREAVADDAPRCTAS